MERMIPEQRVPTVFLIKAIRNYGKHATQVHHRNQIQGRSTNGKIQDKRIRGVDRKQKECEDDVNKGASVSGTKDTEKPKGKGIGKEFGKSKNVAEIRDDTSKPKKKKWIEDVDDEEDEEEEDRDKPRKKPVMARGIVIRN